VRLRRRVRALWPRTGTRFRRMGISGFYSRMLPPPSQKPTHKYIAEGNDERILRDDPQQDPHRPCSSSTGPDRSPSSCLTPSHAAPPHGRQPHNNEKGPGAARVP